MIDGVVEDAKLQARDNGVSCIDLGGVMIPIVFDATLAHDSSLS